MINAYLAIVTHPESILQNNPANLLDLIAFGHCAFGLQVDDLHDTRPGEDRVISSYSLAEPEAQQQPDKIRKADIGVSISIENAAQYFVIFDHGTVMVRALQVRIVRKWHHADSINRAPSTVRAPMAGYPASRCSIVCISFLKS